MDAFKTECAICGKEFLAKVSDMQGEPVCDECKEKEEK